MQTREPHGLSIFLSDSFRGEPAAEKRLNSSKPTHLRRASYLENMRSARYLRPSVSGKSEYLLFPFCSEAGAEGCPGLVGQMKATATKLAIVKKKAKDTKSKTRSGAAQMREAADLVMQQDCHEIAKALSKSSKNGQIQSAKFLYELSEQNEKAGDGDDARKLRSMAEELASATQWTGDWPKAQHNEDDETASDA